MIQTLQQQVINSQQLQIVGNNSQLQSNNAELLKMSAYAGVIHYHPEELVITVKAGTTIAAIEKTLAEQGQALTFWCENTEKTTIGAVYACGNSDFRDAVLGVKIIDGQGRILTFGGQVMKNVAGYDVARMLVGSQGKLAVICEISLKVLPKDYVDIRAISTDKPVQNTSAFVEHIENGLKAIFDPEGKFI